MNVISTVTIADPKGAGPELPAGVPVNVDESDADIKTFLDAGWLVPVDAAGNVQDWRPGETVAPIGAGVAGSDLGSSTLASSAEVGDTPSSSRSSRKA